MTRKLVCWIVATCAVAATACGNADHLPAASSVRDSAGVRIVESTAASTPIWSLADEADLQLGMVEGDAPYLFDRIAAAFRLDDGGVVIANAGTLELRWFDRHGRHVKSAGRRGGGPGEYLAFHAVVRLAGNTLLVHDGWNVRVTIIAPDGSVVRTASTPGLRGIGGGRAVIGRVQDDRLVMTLHRAPDPDTHRIGHLRDTVVVALAALEGPPADTLVQIPSTERVAIPNTGADFGHVRLRDRFTHQAHVAMWNGDIVTGTGESHELRVLDATGSLRMIVRRIDAPPLPVQGAMLEAYVSAVEAVDGPRSAQAVREQQANFAPGRTVPSYAQLMADDAGYLWVRGYPMPVRRDTSIPAHWTVFDRNGSAAARVTTPAGFEPLHIAGQHMVGRVRDEFNVEHVRVYRIARN